MSWTLKRRAAVVVDNDWAGDPDGLVALAHHALSPADGIVAVTATSNNPVFGDPTGKAELAARYARELLDLIGSHAEVPVVAGRDSPFTGEVRENPAARALVEAVRSAGSEPVIVVCGGPLTNVADAMMLDRSIAHRIRLVWVGGGRDAEAFEYNRSTDERAAAFVFEQPGLRIDQFPQEIYTTLSVSVAELEEALTASGDVGRWLWQKYLDLALPPELDVDPVWPLGDNAPLAATALPHAAARFAEDPANPRHRICTGLDTRLIVGDLIARLRLRARAQCT